MWLRKRSKRFEKHSDKIFWGFWFVWFVAMQISAQVVCEVNSIRNRKLEEVKVVIPSSLVSEHREKSKLEELLGEEEEYYMFTTEDGQQYEIGKSNVLGIIPEDIETVQIYKADTYEGYWYFYLLKKKNNQLYEFKE